MSESRVSKKKQNFAAHLPVDRRGMERLGWDELDFLCVTGDAYIDHPSFGTAIVSRLLVSLGYRVGVIAQPDWKSASDFARMGRPRLAVLVTAGNLDSMLSNFSSRHKRRARDVYSPEGTPGKRPDRATIAYCNRIRELWKDIPLLIGGIEASLRRIAHYDYWSDSVRRSILADSRADLLIYGMAEHQLEKIAALLSGGADIATIRDVPGTCWKTHDTNDAPEALELPSFERVANDKRAYAEAFKIFYLEQNFMHGRQLIQDQGAWHVVCNPPAPPLSLEALDHVYSLPYTRRPHPSYGIAHIPALDEVEFSITSHRGCFGECAFCAISTHQGRVVQQRSHESILREAAELTKSENFKGYIHDVGGPTANFRVPSCDKSAKEGACKGKSCLYPHPCKELAADHRDYMSLLRKVRDIPYVKKAFIRSGLRYDYILAAHDGQEFLEELCRHHISGQLKIAPEHVSEKVLSLMRKPTGKATDVFIEKYRAINERLGKKQFLVPYFMSGHPGSDLASALELALYMRDSGIRPEQAQDFTPTPGTLSTCMYHTGIDPMTGEYVHVPRDEDEKAMQRALLHYWMPRNASLVRKALQKLGRTDLIGNGRKCLIKS